MALAGAGKMVAFRVPTAQTADMRLLLPLGASLAVLLASAPGPAGQTTAARPERRITTRQAQRIVGLVARHDGIDLSDSHVEVNSMDNGTEFIPGYSSFIIIRESSTPGPDETLRRYTVNRRSGDVWEMNLCMHYDFPELTRMRRALALRTAPAAGDLAAESKELGCTEKKPAPAS